MTGMHTSKVPIIPKMRPAFVLLRPLGSIVPASIAFRSRWPMTQAAIPSGRQAKMLRMPKISINVPLCAFIIPLWKDHGCYVSFAFVNDAHHWRRAGGVQYATKTESRRPVHEPVGDLFDISVRQQGHAEHDAKHAVEILLMYLGREFVSVEVGHC